MPARTHSYHPSAGIRHRRLAKDGANAGEVATVSARALIMRAPLRRSGAQGGTKPHFAVSNTRPPCRWETRTSGTGSVGATFQLGASPSVTFTASNNRLRSASLRVVAYRPHMEATLRRRPSSRGAG